MADVPYATPVDVEKILPPEDEMPEEDTREEMNLLAALMEATDLVIGYLEREYTGELEDGVPDDVPGAVRRVVARVALRGFLDDPDNPGAESEVQLMGPFSHALNWSKEYQARDFFLTDGDKMRLERFCIGTNGGVAHVPMAGAGGNYWYA